MQRITTPPRAPGSAPPVYGSSLIAIRRYQAAGAAPTAVQFMEKRSGRQDVAVHNWENVLCKYFNGSAGEEVSRVFSNDRGLILRAMRDSTWWEKWGKSKSEIKKDWSKTKIAHGLGDNQESALRDQTKERIQSCKRGLISWFEDRQSSQSSPIAFPNRRRRKQYEDDENAVHRQSIVIAQLAKWARDWINGNNRDDKGESLAKLKEIAAQGGRAGDFAREKLESLTLEARPPASTAVVSVPPDDIPPLFGSDDEENEGH